MHAASTSTAAPALAAPSGPGNAQDTISDHAVYFHALGTPQAQDRLLYSDPTHPVRRLPRAQRAWLRLLFRAGRRAVRTGALGYLLLAERLGWIPEGLDWLEGHLRRLKGEGSPFLASLGLADRLSMVPLHYPVAAVGAALVAAR